MMAIYGRNMLVWFKSQEYTSSVYNTSCVFDCPPTYLVNVLCSLNACTMREAHPLPLHVQLCIKFKCIENSLGNYSTSSLRPWMWVGNDTSSCVFVSCIYYQHTWATVFEVSLQAACKNVYHIYVCNPVYFCLVDVEIQKNLGEERTNGWHK